MTLCGLDFGTSNSTIGVVRDHQSVMVPLEQDADGQWQTTIPSALFFSFESDDVSFGRRAIAHYTGGESGRLMRSMKSLLGSSTMADSTQIKNRFYRFDEIIGFFIGRLKEQAEQFCGDDTPALKSVVIGRPVFFNDDDAALDKDAEQHLANIARVAGFKEVSFQFEPIAAALDYEKQVQKEELALIVDIGGGTSDFTIVRLSPAQYRKADKQADRQNDFLANHGVHLGGTDFDRRLSIAAVMQSFGMGVPLTDRPSLNMPGHYYFDLATWHKIHLLYERAVLRDLNELRVTLSDKRPIDRLLDLLKRRKGHQLAALVEQAKIALSQTPQTTIDIAGLFAADADIDDCVATQVQLRDAIGRDLDRIFAALDATLQQAGISHTDIDTVFTTGGSTALPMIGECISAALPNAKQVAGDLYNSVGSGLLTEAINRYQ